MNTIVGIGGFIAGVALLLTFIFLTLRLVGLIDWPWWVVLSPSWGYVGAGLIYVIIAIYRRK